MPYRDVKTMTARGQVQHRYIHRAVKPASVFQCLIVSADPGRREMFERAASDGGWKTSLCVDAPAALTHIARSFVQLAIVDLEGRAMAEFRPVIEKLSAAGSGLLLIVCGNEGQAEEEIWARQAGAWLYLPGVREGSNFALLCGEARQIAERLYKANGQRPAGAPVSKRG
jgi:DNA-binding NtrC family response regulator